MTEHRPDRALPEEAEFIHRARQGDKEAYRNIVIGVQDRLFGLVLSLVRNHEQAEDLTQEIFVKIYFALPSFEGGSAFYTWVYRIATNHCLDFLRKRRLDQVSLDRPIGEDSESSLKDTLLAPTSEQPEFPSEAPTETSALLDTLEDDQRLILTLRELEGHTYEEISEMFQCPVNTVKSRLNRAREALKEAYLRPYGNIPVVKIVSESREKP